jgi:hypothetical protein
MIVVFLFGFITIVDVIVAIDANGAEWLSAYGL